MTLRDKAREIKAAGEKERGNWTPEPDSATFRQYQYWAEHNPHRVPAKENFCHYWRVVMFWSWWFRVRSTVSDFSTTRTFIGLVVLLWFGIGLGGWLIGGMWYLAAVAAAIPYAALGFISGLMLYDRETDWWVWPAAIITAPISFTVLGIGRLADAWKHSWNEKLMYVCITIASLVVVTMAVLLVMSAGWANILIVACVLLAICAVAFGLFFLGAWVGNLIGAMRRAARDRRDAKWEAMSQEEKEKVWAQREKAGKPTRLGLAVGRFFRGMGDFLVLLGQVVRVNKWKICPVVDIPKTQQDDV